MTFIPFESIEQIENYFYKSVYKINTDFNYKCFIVVGAKIINDELFIILKDEDGYDFIESAKDCLNYMYKANPFGIGVEDENKRIIQFSGV